VYFTVPGPSGKSQRAWDFHDIMIVERVEPGAQISLFVYTNLVVIHEEAELPLISQSPEKSMRVIRVGGFCNGNK